MNRIILAASLLFALPAIAAEPPPPIPVPQDVLQHVSVYLQEGGSHNEGVALNKALIDSIATMQQADQLKAEKDKSAGLEKQLADTKAATKDAPK